MKKLDLVVQWDELQRKRDHVLAVQNMVLQQLDAYSKLMENNSKLVLSPMSYNVCVGLLEQLKLHSFAAFIESTGDAPEIPDGGKPIQIKISHGY